MRYTIFIQQLYIEVETLLCSALLSNGPQQTLRRYRVRPYLERRFWTRPGRTSAWWDNFVQFYNFLQFSPEAAFQCRQRNSLKTINVDGEHFIRFRGKSCVFKFIRLSVDVASDECICSSTPIKYNALRNFVKYNKAKISN